MNLTSSRKIVKVEEHYNKITEFRVSKGLFKMYFDDHLRQFNYQYREEGYDAILTVSERIEDFEKTFKWCWSNIFSQN